MWNIGKAISGQRFLVYNNGGIRAVRVALDGSTVGADFAVSKSTYYCRYAMMAHDGTNSLAVWVGREGNSQYGTYAQIVSDLPVPPLTKGDVYSVDEDQVLTVAAPGVLANDSDADGDPITAVLVSGTSNGTLTLNADGSLVYTPNPNFAGTDCFTYKASDGSLLSQPTGVAIKVNQVNDPLTAAADGPILGLAGNVVYLYASASSDPEHDSLTYKWDFGDGSTLTTSSSGAAHTYNSAGIYTVSLVVSDAQYTSAPFTTTAYIGVTGGGQRSDVDAFLSMANPATRRVDLTAGTTSFDVTIIYGPTIDPNTFQAKLGKTLLTSFSPAANTAETVTIPLSPGRNTLVLGVDGIRSDGGKATDRDRITFVVKQQ